MTIKCANSLPIFLTISTGKLLSKPIDCFFYNSKDFGFSYWRHKNDCPNWKLVISQDFSLCLYSKLQSGILLYNHRYNKYSSLEKSSFTLCSIPVCSLKKASIRKGRTAVFSLLFLLENNTVYFNRYKIILLTIMVNQIFRFAYLGMHKFSFDSLLRVDYRINITTTIQKQK